MPTRNQLIRPVLLASALVEEAVGSLIASEIQMINIFAATVSYSVNPAESGSLAAFRHTLIRIICVLTESRLLMTRTLDIGERLIREVKAVEDSEAPDTRLLRNALARTLSQIEQLKQACRLLPMRMEEELFKLTEETRRLIEKLEQNGKYQGKAKGSPAASPFLSKRKKVYKPSYSATFKPKRASSKRVRYASKPKGGRKPFKRIAKLSHRSNIRPNPLINKYAGIQTSSNLRPKG